MNRPNAGGLPGGATTRPAPGGMAGNRPGLGGAGNRPGGGATTLPGNIGTGNRPGGGNLPGLGGNQVGNRPGIGGGRPGGGANTLPGNIGGNRPGLGGGNNLPGNVGNRPGTGNNLPGNIGNRPGGNNRPGIGGGNNAITGNRPGTGGGFNNGNLAGGGGWGSRPAGPGNGGNWNGRPGLGNGGWNNGNRPGNGNIGNGNIGNGNHWGNSGHWNSNHWNNNNFNNNNVNINNNINNWGGGGWGGGWGGYHGGYWGGNWGWGNHPWGAWAATTAAVGLTSWALGSSFYNYGYASYANPYYVPTQYVVVDSPAVNYSQPISTQAYTPPSNTTIIVNNDPSQGSTANPATPPGTGDAGSAAAGPNAEATAAYNAAADAFKSGDYNAALKGVETALSKLPGDTTLHQFRGLCLFALGKYQEAAGTLYAVLSVEPGWDWTSLSSYYPSVSVYTEQLRKLEAYVKGNPMATDGHFVLGYHYLCAGHSDAALKQLKMVTEQQPQDQVSAALVRMLSPPQQAPTDTRSAPGTAPTPEGTAAPAAPAGKAPATLVGNWKAPGQGGGEIALDIKDDGTFEWKYSKDGKDNAFGGKYEVNQDMLVMENNQGQTMVARVTDQGDNKFKFEVAGGPPNDPGLMFAK